MLVILIGSYITRLDLGNPSVQELNCVGVIGSLALRLAAINK
jgi:hypothetical protein